MTDLKVYKNGKLVPKHKRQQVIDDAHKSRENPWGKPVNVNPTKMKILNLLRWVDFIKEL